MKAFIPIIFCQQYCQKCSNGYCQQRFFESIVEAGRQRLSEQKNQFIVIKIEELKDGLGAGLTKAVKAKNQVNRSLLTLTRNHQINLKSLKSGVDTIILDESLEHRTGALISALDALAKDYS